MERLNLNLPAQARASLRALAKARKTTEGELARELILRSLEQEARRAWVDRVRAAQTPERRARDLSILKALEKWDR